ncbi:MAG: DNA alkylation repair protein [Betaproteobacteria bacterium]|nr:DNA alkylation repair protein [Betaproteobacteria bacterium]
MESTPRKSQRKVGQRAAAGRSTPSTPTAPTAPAVLRRLEGLGSAAMAAVALKFFKTGKGEYGEGDRFFGIRAPVLHALVRDLKGAGLDVAVPLLKSGWHEARSVALLLLVRLYKSGDAETQKAIYALYLKSTRYINGWDLVDLSAEHIVGAYLADKPALRKRVLDKLARSESMWERRIAMLATFHYIKKGDYTETLRIAEILVHDSEDLIQKAVGWMLREVGKRIGEEVEEPFLKRFQNTMPRTMLRYAIERFSEPKRKRYLAGRG